jgi:hypothetical protein
MPRYELTIEYDGKPLISQAKRSVSGGMLERVKGIEPSS